MRLVDSQNELLYLVAGEDATTARAMLFWPIEEFFAMQVAQQKILKERADAVAKSAKK